MLKGHAKIELKNVKTGKITTYEHDNLVTDAVARNLSELVKAAAGNEETVEDIRINGRLLPLNTYGMGGILLYNKALEEYPENTPLPSLLDNEIVGHASTADDVGGSSKLSDYGLSSITDEENKRGQFNNTESGVITDEDGNVTGYKFVYDFGTDKANGEINSVALTSAVCGYAPWGYSSKSRFAYKKTDNAILNNAVDFDFDTKIMTCAVIDFVTNKLQLTKFRIPIDEIRVNTTLLMPEQISVEEIDIPEGSDGINRINSGNYGIVYEKNSDCYYVASLFGSSSGVDSSNPRRYYISKINKDGLMESKTVQFITSTGSLVGESVGYRNVAIYNGWFYLIFSTDNALHLYGTTLDFNNSESGDIETTTETRTIAIPNTKGGTGESRATIYGKNLVSGMFVLATDEEKGTSSAQYRPNATGGYIGTTADYSVFIDRSGVAVTITSSNAIYIGSNFAYLATINNLEGVIEKSSATTMKITYTLTESK